MAEKPVFQPTKVKKIIQSDREIGKLVKQVPPVMSKLTELFLAKLIAKGSKYACDSDQFTLSPGHLIQVIENH